MKLAGKKGMSMKVIVWIIIIIAGFMIIALLIRNFVTGMSDKEAELACRTSIGWRASSAITIDGLISKTELKTPVLCRTIDDEIEGDKKKLMREFAKKMARCWWMFHEGTYEEIVKGTDVHLLPGVFDLKGNNCFVCYAITVEEKKIEGGGITETELKDFLINTNHSEIDMSYLNYFQHYKGSGKVGILESKILPRNAYGIVFMSKNHAEVSFLEGIIDIFSSSDVEDIYGETQRDASVIILDDLETAQEHCFRGDIAGE